ncbi:unnamed protein product [Amoebophrya sp. A120]|nr:unnamed protein product [Amoebophrya sp. A120]|eukprot:GSA120T00015820001.1
MLQIEALEQEEKRSKVKTKPTYIIPRGELIRRRFEVDQTVLLISNRFANYHRAVVKETERELTLSDRLSKQVDSSTTLGSNLMQPAKKQIWTLDAELALQSLEKSIVKTTAEQKKKRESEEKERRSVRALYKKRHRGIMDVQNEVVQETSSSDEEHDPDRRSSSQHRPVKRRSTASTLHSTNTQETGRESGMTRLTRISAASEGTSGAFTEFGASKIPHCSNRLVLELVETKEIVDTGPLDLVLPLSEAFAVQPSSTGAGSSSGAL